MKRLHLLILLILTAASGSLVWMRLKIVSVSYSLNSLERQERELIDEIGRLKMKMIQSQSPKELERMAAQRFGMRPITPQQIVHLKE